MNISSISMFNVRPMNFARRKPIIDNEHPVCPRATEDLCDHFEKASKGEFDEFYSGVYDDHGEAVFGDEHEGVYPEGFEGVEDCAENHLYPHRTSQDDIDDIEF